MITALFGKTYVWTRDRQTGQWHLERVPEVTIEHSWSDLDYDVLSDLRERWLDVSRP